MLLRLTALILVASLYQTTSYLLQPRRLILFPTSYTPRLGTLTRHASSPTSPSAQSLLDNALSSAPPGALYPAKHDSFLERVAVFLLSIALSFFLVTPELRNEARRHISPSMSFLDFCSVTKLLLRKTNGSIDDLQSKIVSLLNGLIPQKVKIFFREEYAKTPQVICEQSGEWIHRFGLISWLIGAETERFMVTMPKTPSDDNLQSAEVQWLSGLEVKQCRYLLESGCKSTCVNICKIPTQRFFNEVVGLPLTMDPDYATGACKFYFGVSPPPKELDAAFNSPCYLGCSLSAEKKNSINCGL